MREVLPGTFHWTTLHPRIHIPVSSYWLDEAGVLIDPLVPTEEGLEWFAGRRAHPTAVLLSNRHHYRESARFVEAFGCTVHCNRAGMHEFTHGETIEGFDPGDLLPGGVRACEVGGLCPDDSALYLPDKRAVAFADGLVRGSPLRTDGPLGFVPDVLMDDPPGHQALTARRFRAPTGRAALRARPARARRPSDRRRPRAAGGTGRDRWSNSVRARELSCAVARARLQSGPCWTRTSDLGINSRPPVRSAELNRAQAHMTSEGCQASPSSRARRMARSELPPTQISACGGCGSEVALMERPAPRRSRVRRSRGLASAGSPRRRAGRGP